MGGLHGLGWRAAGQPAQAQASAPAGRHRPAGFTDARGGGGGHQPAGRDQGAGGTGRHLRRAAVRTHGTGLRPTPLGELALLRAGRMRHDLELWAREIASVHEGARPTCRWARCCVGGLAEHGRQRAVPAARRDPDLHRATTDQLVPMLRGHELDCVISRATSTLVADDLTHHVLYRQRPCLVAHVASARRLAANPTGRPWPAWTGSCRHPARRPAG